MRPMGVVLRWVVLLEMVIGVLLLTAASVYKDAGVFSRLATVKTATKEATKPEMPTPTTTATLVPTVQPTPVATRPSNTPVPTKTATSVPEVTATIVATSSPTVTVTITSPTTAPAGSGSHLCTDKVVPIFLSPEGEQNCGVLEAASEVTVVKHQSGRYEVTLEGWQPESSTSVVYALEGIRIRVALLKACAQTNVQVLETVTDPNTDQKWRRVKLTGAWVPENDLAADLTAYWENATSLYHKSCSVCHALHDPKEHTANQWPGILKSMRPRTPLSKDQIIWVEAFLQYNAKDTSKQGILLPCSAK